MSFAKSIVVGSAMGEDMEAVEDEGEVGTDMEWWRLGGLVVVQRRKKNVWKPIPGCQRR
jgi:hypothetical protein